MIWSKFQMYVLSRTIITVIITLYYIKLYLKISHLSTKSFKVLKLIIIRIYFWCKLFYSKLYNPRDFTYFYCYINHYMKKKLIDPDIRVPKEPTKSISFLQYYIFYIENIKIRKQYQITTCIQSLKAFMHNALKNFCFAIFMQIILYNPSTL